MPSKSHPRTLYGLVFLSGACGLIYEVVWHRYLAILLGAQARATAVVLAIFLGGISVGYAVFGRWTRWKPWNPLLVYALVEVGMGVWGICFPAFFHVAMPLTSALYGKLGVTNIAVDLGVAILLLGFPTFLMGGTLPLLTQGMSRDFFDASLTHARIYGFNTVGACLGCLLAGYWLIPGTSLGYAVQMAGAVNLFIGSTVYFLYVRRGAPKRKREEEKETPVASRVGLSERQALLLGIGFLSGFYTITVQTMVIRLMGLSTGASNYNFTLIVAIFIFCLGFSSLLVRKIANYSFERLFWNQLAVAMTLFALYLSGDYWAYWVHVLRATLRDIPENFFFFQFLLGVGFLGILCIPIGLCGFTLPLCFHLIKDTKEGLGHRVGQLYGVNTLGCVLGALVGGYWLLNFFNLDQLLKVCVFVSGLSAMAAAYLVIPQAQKMRPQIFAAGGLLTMTLVGTFLAPLYAKDRFIQPFRHPQPTPATFDGADAFGKYLGRSTDLLLWRDGPNTSVGIGASHYHDVELSRTIFINGKSDGNTRGDYFTTVMLAHIPGLLQDNLDHACIIGFGTGTTIGTIAQYPEVKKVDVVEIANTLLKNAPYFDRYNNGVSTNAKVHFNEMDAFRFFGGTDQKFNLIISEPSNPWVAGIENLYSEEFYDLAKSRLEENGVFVQWIHTYSFTDDLFKMVLRTMSAHFPTVYIFQLRGGDYALVGRDKPYSRQDLLRGAERMRADTDVKRALDDAGLTNFESVLALEIVPPDGEKALAGTGEIHTLESPRLSNEAAKAFFVGQSARVQALRRGYREYFASLDSSLLPSYLGSRPVSAEVVKSFRDSFCDNPVSKNSYLCEETMALSRFQDGKFVVDGKYDDIVTNRDLASFDAYHQKIDVSFGAGDLQIAYKMFEAYKKYASPLAHIPPERFMAPVEQCLRSVESDNELYGECLLQKILVLETVPVATLDLASSVNQFLNWFPRLPANAPNHAKLEEARNILLKMASPQK